jgi:hypothetical protein
LKKVRNTVRVFRASTKVGLIVSPNIDTLFVCMWGRWGGWGERGGGNFIKIAAKCG